MPGSRMAGNPDGVNEVTPDATPPAKENVMARDRATPEEDDPLWEQLGATRISDGQSDISLGAANINSPSNFTEFSPSLVLGKNVVALGEFKLLRKLGEGAMGAVYKAHQASFNRVVALKILFPHVANNPKLVKRLYREGMVMGQLDHPNIVQAFAIGEAQGCHYIAMEYVSGRSMQKWLAQLGRLPVGDAVRIILDCARALAYAHGLKMIHRDVKPDNVLVTRKGVVKVADLGMVKTSEEDMSLTQTGHAVGTPWYMPLEQARNAKEIDGRSDIYALGCTLYAFLTGQPPFIGRTIVDVIKSKEVGTFAPARQTNSDVPERLDLIIAKMTAKLPKNRYQNCDEVIKDLESLGPTSESLSFLNVKPVDPEVTPEEYEAIGQTCVTPATKSRADVDFAQSAAPALDPDLWFVQTKLPDGTSATRKYTTAQIHKMLEEGTMTPTAKASHQPTEGFRTLGTYKEFQGVALGTLAKKAADKNTARYRGLYKKIEEKELEREKEEQLRRGDRDETTMQATRRYWLGILLKALPVILAIIFLFGLMWYFTS
jgi:eukaryotic-like serine/threonine-protein kinase